MLKNIENRDPRIFLINVLINHHTVLLNNLFLYLCIPNSFGCRLETTYFESFGKK